MDTDKNYSLIFKNWVILQWNEEAEMWEVVEIEHYQFEVGELIKDPEGYGYVKEETS